MTHRERLWTALSGGVPDRVPCALDVVRWVRGRDGCACPRHQLLMADELDLDVLVTYGQYTWQSMSNDYLYSPGGGHGYAASGSYGDLPDVDVDIAVHNEKESVWYRRRFRTPAGDLSDVIRWARPGMGYGDGPNPHRVEPLVKSRADLEALRYLYPPPRRDLARDIPMVLREVGDRALLVAMDCTHAGSWGMEPLGPENMLLSAVADPELLAGLCRLANVAHLRNLRAMLDQGIRVVLDSWFQAGLSVGWSPATIREVFLPLAREAADLAHEYGALYIYYDPGKMRGILAEIAESGADVICGLQPPPLGDVDLSEAKRLSGNKALMGGLEPVYTFDLGTPEVVREAVRTAITAAGRGGGFVLRDSIACAPNTPLESLRAAVQASKDFGVYGRDL